MVLGGRPSDAEIEALIASADVDGDGQVRKSWGEDRVYTGSDPIGDGGDASPSAAVSEG